MESIETCVPNDTVLDACEQFRDDHQVDDQWGCEERVLADGVHGDGIASSHHEFGMVLIHGDFGVAHGRDIFDDDAMVDGTAGFVVEEDLIGTDDIVYNR